MEGTPYWREKHTGDLIVTDESELHQTRPEPASAALFAVPELA